MTDCKTHINLILKTLPDLPGVYRYYDETGKLLYVGKAKNLKKRVSQYFLKQQTTRRLQLIVSKIRDIQITVVNSEWEALLLENSMIKKLKPFYNVMLRDDKTYPWVAITKEPFPRLIITRKPDKNLHEFFGPYVFIHTLNNLMHLFKEAYQLRTCKILEKRPCLQYQIKKCAAPCAGKISEEEYNSQIYQIKEILKGNTYAVILQLKKEMTEYANQLEFEKAHQLKQIIAMIEQFKTKSVVVNEHIGKVDVFSIDKDEESAFVNFMRVIDGSVIQSFTLELISKNEETEEELLLMAIAEIVERFGKLSQEIIVPFQLEIELGKHQFTVPQRFEKKKLLDLSQKNAYFARLNKRKKQELADPERHQNRVLVALQKALGMNELPIHIECFDNSNTQGEEPVAAMVCFLNAKPAKKEYRHYNIKTVEGANDFASMYEVVHRRYARLKEENVAMPQLVVIDGGKGQLGMAYQALKDIGLQDKIFLIGIAKRLEDIYKVGDNLPLYLDKKSEAQKLLQRLRDEVHHFGITHHRNRRSKKSIASALDTIPGIGKETSAKLLLQFKSVKRIQQASEEELTAVIGKARAKIIIQHIK
ncbi:MAG: excinuclease ABC subunit UvrC [Bacteroidales bacterium]|jgi:excinuclease ABC subunit C|nr:excinuclease ABC subunit UvrC [Bacteroidales bacterium]